MLKRTELTSKVTDIQDQLGNLARAVAEKDRQGEEMDSGEEPAGEADGQQGNLPEDRKLRHFENCQRAASMLSGRSASEPPRRSRAASAWRSGMVSPFSGEASAPECVWSVVPAQVLKPASAFPDYVGSVVSFSPPFLLATDPCGGQRT